MTVRRHILSLVVFFTVALASTYLAMLDEAFSEEQYLYATASTIESTIASGGDETLSSDFVFGQFYADGQLPAQLNQPFLRLIGAVRSTLGGVSPLLAFRVLAGPMCLLFLCGMYFLLFRITAGATVSAFVAILSMGTIQTVGGWHWGVGALSTVTPAGLFLAISPFVILGFVHHRRRPKKLLRTFAIIGLLGNLHFISALTLGGILLLTYLIDRRLRPVTLFTALCSAAILALCILPTALYHHALAAELAALPGASAVDVGTILSAVRCCGGDPLYPELIGQALQWGIYIGVLLGLSITMLWRHDDDHASLHLGMWIWVALLGVIVSLGGVGLMQSLAESKGRLILPPAILQASCWTMLALFVLLARGLRNVTRVMRFSPSVLLWARVILLAAWLLPSDNLALVRHQMYEWFTAGLRESDKPMRLQELRDRRVGLAELEAIGLWLRENTPPDALVICNQPRMRVIARRGILADSTDVAMFVERAPWLVKPWHRLVEMQDQWFASPVRPQEIVTEFRALRKEWPYSGIPAKSGQKPRRAVRPLPAEHCYLILPAHTNLIETHPMIEIFDTGNSNSPAGATRPNSDATKNTGNPNSPAGNAGNSPASNTGNSNPANPGSANSAGNTGNSPADNPTPSWGRQFRLLKLPK